MIDILKSLEITLSNLFRNFTDSGCFIMMILKVEPFEFRTVNEIVDFMKEKLSTQ